MTNIISVINQKGGVGKTTTVLNVAAGLAVLDNKVLVIDFDPQGNLSSGLGIDIKKRKGVTIYDVINDNSLLHKAILHTKISNLNIISSDINLSALEIEISQLPKREHILSDIIFF